MTSEELLLPFEGLRKERELIGKMLLAYNELEYVLLDMLIAVLGDGQAAIRAMYQLRSEANRLAVAEAIITPEFTRSALGGSLKESLDALGHCKAIRNQFAHCLWTFDEGTLRFANLELTAKSKGEKCQVVSHPLTATLLRNQWAYFEYASHMLLWVNQEYRRKNNQSLHGSIIPKPKRLPPPKLHSRGEPRTRHSTFVGRWRLKPKQPPTAHS